MRRVLLTWLVTLVGALLLGAVAVAVLNSTAFGPGAFVQVYLSALARGDASGALTLPGVQPDLRGAALLSDGGVGGLRDIRQTADEPRNGDHLITMSWTTPSGSGSTTFQVERVGTRFGLFPEWGFAVSPVATVSVTVEHDSRFTVNGVQEVSTGSGKAEPFSVLVPGVYEFAHTSRYLTAAPDTVLADTVGQRVDATVSTRANAAFVAAVSELVDRQLTSCATQTVLFPTGCPFGESITNRVSSTPAWSIVHPPEVTLLPGSTFGSWAIPPTPGTAHLTVQVTSLYDGTTSTFDQDVPFVLQADVALAADGSITVTER